MPFLQRGHDRGLVAEVLEEPLGVRSAARPAGAGRDAAMPAPSPGCGFVRAELGRRTLGSLSVSGQGQGPAGSS